MAFRTLALCVSLALTVTCYDELANNYYGTDSQIEEFPASSYAAVSSNYHLAKLPCTGCPRKVSATYSGDEYLVLNFSTTPDAVLLNGKQIYPATDPAPEIFVHQVLSYTDLRMFDYDYRNLYGYGTVFYPLSRLGYFVNVTSQDHPPGSSNSTSPSSSLITLDFRVIQVGPSVQDCLDSVVLTVLRTGTDGASVVKGTRFVPNEESFLPDTEDANNGDAIYPYERPPIVATSGARKCHPSAEDFAAKRLACRYYDYSYDNCPSYTHEENFTLLAWLVIAPGSFLVGVFIALLGVYFRAGLHKVALRMASAVRSCSVGAWARLRGGRGGAIRLPTSVKKDVKDSQEQE